MIEYSKINCGSQPVDCSAIVNDQLSALELAITPDMGHGGGAVTSRTVTFMSVICLHCFLIYIRTQKEVWIHYKNAFEPHFKIRILVL